MLAGQSGERPAQAAVLATAVEVYFSCLQMVCPSAPRPPRQIRAPQIDVDSLPVLIHNRVTSAQRLGGTASLHQPEARCTLRAYCENFGLLHRRSWAPRARIEPRPIRPTGRELQAATAHRKTPRLNHHKSSLPGHRDQEKASRCTSQGQLVKTGCLARQLAPATQRRQHRLAPPPRPPPEEAPPLRVAPAHLLYRPRGPRDHRGLALLSCWSRTATKR